MVPKLRFRRRAPIIVPSTPSSDAPPGTIAPPKGATRPELHAIFYSATSIREQKDTTLAQLAQPNPDEILWLNIDGVGDADTFRALGKRFGLHPLALEDVVDLHQRPKTEAYDDHAYIVAKMPRPTDNAQIELEQMSVFVGDGFVITVRERVGDCLDPVRLRLRKKRGRIRKSGADYLAYAILDALIDDYYPLADQVNNRLERIEEQVLTNPEEHLLAEIHSIRSDLHRLRRTLSLSRESMGQLARGDIEPFTPKTLIFLRDCQDHCAQLLDAVDSCRELSGSLMDLYMSGLSNRMNDVMKMLTLIATIFIPLGFIAGVYGMNFDPAVSPYNMPELSWAMGYPFALGLMGTTALGFLWFFKRRGWLG